MKIISKRFKFKQYWELIMIDGQVHFLAKDILPFFGYSISSQGTIRDSIDNRSIMILSGEQVKAMKHVTSRGMVLNKSGLMNFIMSRDAERQRQGFEFLKWVEQYALPKLEKEWEKEVQQWEYDDVPFENEPEHDLFSVTRERQMEKMIKKVDQLEKTLESKTQTISALQSTMAKHWDMIKVLEKKCEKNDQSDKMISVDELVKHLTNGNRKNV